MFCILLWTSFIGLFIGVSFAGLRAMIFYDGVITFIVGIAILNGFFKLKKIVSITLKKHSVNIPVLT